MQPIYPVRVLYVAIMLYKINAFVIDSPAKQSRGLPSAQGLQEALGFHHTSKLSNVGQDFGREQEYKNLNEVNHRKDQEFRHDKDLSDLGKNLHHGVASTGLQVPSLPGLHQLLEMEKSWVDNSRAQGPQGSDPLSLEQVLDLEPSLTQQPEPLSLDQVLDMLELDTPHNEDMYMTEYDEDPSESPLQPESLEDIYSVPMEDIPLQHQAQPVEDDIYNIPGVAEDFVSEMDRELRLWRRDLASRQWQLDTNVTADSKVKLDELRGQFLAWRARRVKVAAKFNLAMTPSHVSRQVQQFLVSGAPNDPAVGKRMAVLQTRMLSSYTFASSRRFSSVTSSVCGEAGDVMSRSRDPEVLRDAWISWRDDVSREGQMREDYREFVQLANTGARDNGYSDYGHFWRQSQFFQTPDIDRQVASLWRETRPLYVQLHAYIRRKLRQQYGSDVIGESGTIPAHLLGDMWAQDWSNIFDLADPFPTSATPEVTTSGDDVISDVTERLQAAEAYFLQVGLRPLPHDFWNTSMLVKPQDRLVNCHAQAFDMYRPGQFRVKMCACASESSLRRFYHELGHVQYAMAYTDQPTIFREPANAALAETVGDVIQIAAANEAWLDEEGRSHECDIPTHADVTTRQEHDIRHLLRQALRTVAFLPFGLLVDRWRYDVMAGYVTPRQYNAHWWHLRHKYQGVKPPVPRSERDFDAGSKYHIPAHRPYLGYFVSTSLQFQVLESLCRGIDHKGPLHTCRLSTSRKATWPLRNLMSAGSSQPWQDLLQDFTGSRTVSARALVNYFRPLQRWLEADNRKHGERTGW